MKVVRFTATPDGGSQFVEVDIPIDNASTDVFNNTVHRSAVVPAQSVMVTDMPEGLYQDWHPASRRQLLFVLSGPSRSKLATARSTAAAAATCFSLTMSAAAAIARAPSAAQPGCCSCTCRPKRKSRLRTAAPRDTGVR